MRMWEARALSGTAKPVRVVGAHQGHKGGWRRIAWIASLDNARNCLLLAAIPLAMSIVNVNWLFTPIGSIDPWVNVGYFLHYSDPTFLNSYYKIARLSWIIPGFAAYQVFSPVVASYVLHVGCLLV